MPNRERERDELIDLVSKSRVQSDPVKEALTKVLHAAEIASAGRVAEAFWRLRSGRLRRKP